MPEMAAPGKPNPIVVTAIDVDDDGAGLAAAGGRTLHVRDLAPGESAWATYQRVVAFPLGASRARGVELDVAARRRAGLDDEFIAGLAAAEPTRPGGGPRARAPRRS